ncbi:DUF3310 domain-containing protein [Listeria monocytogenes]|nr:DUF3310 domain-containing protein [Listeria monocytogenes]EAG2584228.1 DUF3310 domain-containing protein [Listeria monocytogenes]
MFNHIRKLINKWKFNQGIYIEPMSRDVIIPSNKEEQKMKLYHTETQEDFNALLEKLKNEGCSWFFGEPITSYDSRLWERKKQNTVIFLQEEGISYGTLSYAEDNYYDTPIEKYKAKESLVEVDDVPEELSEATVEFSKICDEEDLTKLFGFDKDGVFHSSYIPLRYVDTSNDNVNNPDGIETLNYIKAKVSDYPSYAVGNILDYVSRYEHKNGIEDLKKAQFYLNDLIEWMESE